MWICDGSEKILGELASKNNPDDLLNAKLINGLGYMVGERYDSSRYDIESICVSTGLTRFLVCGLIQCDDFNYFSYIIGEDGIKRSVEDIKFVLYIDKGSYYDLTRVSGYTDFNKELDEDITFRGHKVVLVRTNEYYVHFARVK